MKSEFTIVTDRTFAVIQSAVNKLVDIVRLTLGPASNKVIIDRQIYRMVVDDGVQIARDFELNDPAENTIIKIIREVAIRTNDRAGDGTTGALIILQAIINEVARRSKFDGRKIEIELRRGLEEVRKQLLSAAHQIKSKEDLKKVALVSYDDEKVAQMIADTQYALGRNGTITIDKSPTMETTVAIVEGAKIGYGHISPYMVTDHERGETIFENPYILLTDFRLTESSDIFPIMEKMMRAKARNLVVVAENVEEHALATLVTNLPQVMNTQTGKLGAFPSVAINAPSADVRTILMEDLSTLTGAKVFSSAKGDRLENIEVADLGRAEKVIVRREETMIIGPKGEKKAILSAADKIKKIIETETDDKRKELAIARLGMYERSLAVIRVGAPTDNELKALKYKVEDAVHSVRSALRHGVVRGAGLALADIKTSSDILNVALKCPYRQLCENAGVEPEEFTEDIAVNFVTGARGNYLKIGVIDPVAVLIAALESAVSIAAILLTSKSIIVESINSENNE